MFKVNFLGLRLLSLFFPFFFFFFIIYTYNLKHNASLTHVTSFRLTTPIPVGRGVHGPVRSGFNPKIQPNRKIIFFINTTRTEPRTGSNRTGFVRFRLVFQQKKPEKPDCSMVTMITIVHSLPLPLSDDVKKYLYINNQTIQ